MDQEVSTQITTGRKGKRSSLVKGDKRRAMLMAFTPNLRVRERTKIISI